jgi:hypothetical protein
MSLYSNYPKLETLDEGKDPDGLIKKATTQICVVTFEIN